MLFFCNDHLIDLSDEILVSKKRLSVQVDGKKGIYMLLFTGSKSVQKINPCAKSYYLNSWKIQNLPAVRGFKQAVFLISCVVFLFLGSVASRLNRYYRSVRALLNAIGKSYKINIIKSFIAEILLTSRARL